MELYKNLAMVAAAVVALIVFVNIVTQVTKKVVKSKKFPIQVWVLIVSIVSTVLAGVIAFTTAGVPIHWYEIVEAVALGIVVSYGAMFGYDNLYKQVAQAIKSIKDIEDKVDKPDSQSKTK